MQKVYIKRTQIIPPRIANHDSFPQIYGDNCEPFKGNWWYLFFPMNIVYYIDFFNDHKLILHLGITSNSL